MRSFVHRSCDTLITAACVIGIASCNRLSGERVAKEGMPPTQGRANIAGRSPTDLKDANIRQAVVDEIFRAPHIRAGTFIVDCKDGIVDLVGSVDDLLAKQRAVAIAETVRGVRSVSDRIRVQPVARSDSNIVAGVKGALAYDPTTRSLSIFVNATDGIVRLAGSVPSWEERQLVGRLAASVRGVKDVKNEITVNYASMRSDAEIRQDVLNRLGWDAFLTANSISVAVAHGKVNLEGAVGSAAESSRAYADAWVPGVRDVDASKLTIDWWDLGDDLRKHKPLAKTDSQIQAALKEAMTRDPRVKPFQIDVRVDRGKVTLFGDVSSIKAKLAAESLARDTVGVASVEDLLDVKPTSSVSDNVLKNRIKSALAEESEFNTASANVNVSSGQVTLTGRVPTQFDSAIAVDLANSQEGVKSVVNHLTVDAPEVAYVWTPYVDPYGPYVDGWNFVSPISVQSDTDIIRGIERELEWSPFVDARQIKVDVHNGKATLRGSVQTLIERQVAGADALKGGATSVDNELTVG